MKWIGQHIWKFVSRFRNDVYMENIDTGTIASGGNLGLDSNNKIVKANEASGGISFDGSTANGVLTYKDSDEASVESNLTYNSETLTIGENDTGSASIIRNASNDIGGQLNLAAGSGTGTDKAGGDIHLFGGASTGVAAGGSLKFSSSVSDGSSDATGNTRTEKFEVTPEGNITIKGTIIGNSGSDNDLQISTDGSMLFPIDRDNDETSQSFAWENFSTEIMNLDESGNLQIDGGLTTGSTSFVNSSGVVQVATQGTIDHDSLANFVAAEHVDWAGSSAGTIHSSNIPTLNQDTTGNADTATALETARNINGVSFDGTGDITVTAAGSTLSDTVTVAKGGTGATTLASNSVLTGNGTSAVQAESGLTYDSEALNVGDDDNGSASIRRKAHSDEAGGEFEVRGGDAGGTDKAGGNLKIMAGRGTGSAAGGNVQIWAGGASGGGSSSSNVSNVQCATFKTDQSTILLGNLIFEGASPDAHETTFSITDPTNDRTVTVPDADVDLTKVRAASTTLDGVVELATTAEADTGTDTTRAITAAGLKSHVDARYHYQYISFLSNMTTASNWKTMSNNGISNHSWNQSLGTTGTTVGSSTGTVPVSTIAAGIVVPYDSTLVGFKCVGMGGSNHQYELGLMIGVATFNDYATFDVTLRAYKAAVSASPDNNYQSRPIAIEDLTRSYSVTAGHVIYPCVKSASGSGTNKVSWTIVLKTLIPS